MFYIDSTGQHGLVAAMEDLPGTYEWGCFQENVYGADGLSIGTGYQNTLDIVAQNCQTESSEITAAQATLYAEINCYTDWFLPSKNELELVYFTLACDTCPYSHLFSSQTYWSSLEVTNSRACYITFTDGNASNDNKEVDYFVRPIRSF